MEGPLITKQTMKKLFAAIIFSIALLFTGNVFAQDPPNVNVYVFWSSGCPHCRKEEAFLEDLVKEKPNVSVLSREVSKSFSSAILFSEVGKFLGADTGGVPFTVIGSNHYAGFGSAETTGEVFRQAIEKVESGEDYDILEEFFKENGQEEEREEEEKEEEEEKKEENGENNINEGNTGEESNNALYRMSLTSQLLAK